ncbi:MAG: hypothetical protein J6U22_05795 [Bacteroidaceae bacterium]|nr:hypothetical protein [Bacteroidaceae bacterium]
MRCKLFIALFILVSSICYSQVYPGYFQKNSYYNSCDYIVKGEEVDKKIVAYVYDESILALKIHVLDNYGYDISDTVWLYPDLERYFNKRNRIDTSKRDTVLELSLDDADFYSDTRINYAKQLIGEQQCYYRFWVKNDSYVYSLEDNYFPLPIINNRVSAYLNKTTRLIEKRNIKVKHFERRILRKRNRQMSK